MPTVGLDGTRFYYEERGKGPALVLVPTTAADTAMLAAAASLLATSHRVITYDRRAFGRSTAAAPRPKTYLRRHVDDLALLCRELGAVPATLVGWGWGGIVALGAAAHHSSVVRDVVLFEPALHAKLSLRAAAFGKLGLDARAAKRFFESTFGSKAWKSLDRATRDALLADPKAVAAELAAGSGDELTNEILTRVKVPVSIVLGAKSPPTSLVRFYPRARVVRLPDEDDALTILRRPNVFVDSLREALANPTLSATTRAPA